MAPTDITSVVDVVCEDDPGGAGEEGVRILTRDHVIAHLQPIGVCEGREMEGEEEEEEEKQLSSYYHHIPMHFFVSSGSVCVTTTRLL